MDKSWSIIKFPDEEDTVAAVPTSWLHGNQCYWPPWSRERINSAIRSCKPPDKETWQMHSCIPLRNNVFDDFETVTRKLEKALNTSDLESEPQPKPKNLAKRKSVKTTFTKYASFEMSEDESALPDPPKFKGMKTKRNYAETGASITTICSDNEHSVETQIETARILPRSEIVGSNATFVPARKNTELDSQQIIEYLKQIVRKQNILQSTLAELAEDVAEVKSKISNNSNNSVIESVPSIFQSLILPVTSQIDIQNLEVYLMDETAMMNAVKEIASSGGKNVYEFIYRATQKLITNKYAEQYSYFGKQKKMNFSKLKLNMLLKKSAMKIFNCSEKDVEVSIAKWLRRCKERARNE